jgi:hypothetical protein
LEDESHVCQKRKDRCRRQALRGSAKSSPYICRTQSNRSRHLTHNRRSIPPGRLAKA